MKRVDCLPIPVKATFESAYLGVITTSFGRLFQEVIALIIKEYCLIRILTLGLVSIMDFL